MTTTSPLAVFIVDVLVYICKLLNYFEGRRNAENWLSKQPTPTAVPMVPKAEKLAGFPVVTGDGYFRAVPVTASMAANPTSFSST